MAEKAVQPNQIQHDPKRLSFIVFSDDWGVHPSSSQHLFRRIALNHNILWVNTIGMRNPRLTWSDFNKIIRKIKKMFGSLWSTPKECAENSLLHVRQPFMLPFSSIPLVRKFNRYSVAWSIRQSKSLLDINNAILVSTVPNACDYVEILDNSKVIYYCVDDFIQWPGINHKVIREMENQLLERSEVLIATSHKLYHKLRKTGKPTHLLTHGVDVRLFSHDALAEHPCLTNIPKPRVGYFGLIDERSDQSLIATISSSMKDYSFVMAGPIAADFSYLKACSNIYFTGSVKYAELPSLIKGLDILFIPYLVNDFTDSISPLKLKEYLVTGKPVITTPLAEAKIFAQYLVIANSLEEWRIALIDSLNQNHQLKFESIMKVMRSESWENKAQVFLDICMH